MRKWLALLAVVLVCSVAALVVLRASREPVGGSASPSPSTASAARGESAAEPILSPDPAVVAGSPPPLLVTDVQHAAAPENPSVGEPLTKLGRVILRARLPFHSVKWPGHVRHRAWWVEFADVGGRLRPDRHWNDSSTVEFDLSRHFDRARIPPSTLSVGLDVFQFGRDSKSIDHFQSLLELDVAGVPTRRRFEPEVLLDITLAPPVSSEVYGTLLWDCSPSTGALHVRNVSMDGAFVTEGEQRIECASGVAAFAFAPNLGGAVEWLTRIDGYLPVAGRIETPRPGRYNIGSIVLSRGERLSGRVSPPLEGARIRAVCLATPVELRAWLGADGAPRRDLLELRPMDSEARLGADGSFEFSGLFAAQYRLELRGVPVLDVVELTPRVVSVPAAGIELDTHLATVDLEVVATSTELPRLIEVRLPVGNGSYEMRRALTLDKNGRIRVPIRTGRMHEFVCGERVVPVLVHEVGSTVNVRL